jgi:SPP1 family predicted phage head-tail adaptor
MIEQMRSRITIQKSTTENDRYGNHTLVWEDYYKCYAYVNNLSGTEYWAASEVNAQDEVNFIIRYCEKAGKVTSDHYRIIFRGKIYNISFVDNVQYSNRSIKIRAKRVER